MKTKNKNICFFAPRYHTNQTDIVRILQNEGYDISFLVLKKSEPENYEHLEPIILKPGKIYSFLSKYLKFFDLNRNQRRFQTISFFQLMKYLRREKSSYIIIRNPDVVPGFLVLLYSFLFVKKVILYHQAPYYGKKSRKTRTIQILNRIFGTCSYTPVLGDDRFSKTVTIKNKYLAFPVPINKKVDYNNKNKGNINFNILSICKFEERKKIPLLINAFTHLNIKNKKLTIIGRCITDSEIIIHQEIKQLVREMNRKSEVEILTNVPNEEISDYYIKNDLFVLPSRDEPYGYSVLEAIGSGLPVICSDTNGSRHYVEDGVNGYIFKTDDVENLKNSIKAIYNNNYKNMGINSLQIAQNKYSSEMFFSNFKHILNCTDQTE